MTISSTIELAGVMRNDDDVGRVSFSGIFFKIGGVGVVRRGVTRRGVLVEEELGRALRLIDDAIIGIDVVSGTDKCEGE